MQFPSKFVKRSPAGAPGDHDPSGAKPPVMPPSLMSRSLASHLTTALLGLACTLLALGGATALSLLGQRAATEQADIAVAATKINAGLESAAVALKTATLSGNRDYLSRYDQAWTEQILPYQKALARTLTASPFVSLQFDGDRLVVGQWSDIEQVLHRLNGTQTALNTLLLGSLNGRVYHLPAENLMNDGNTILRLATRLSQKELVKQVDLSNTVQNFQDIFHKAHAETLLFLLQEVTAEKSRQAEDRLKLAQQKLDEIARQWPQTMVEEKALFEQLRSQYESYRTTVVEALIRNRNINAEAQIQTYLALAAKDTDAAVQMLHDLQDSHKDLVAFWTNSTRIAFAILAVIVLGALIAAIALSYRAASRFARDIAGPLDAQIQALESFQRTYKVLELAPSPISELDHLSALSNAARRAVADHVRDIETDLSRTRAAHKRTAEILEYASSLVRDHLRKLQLDLAADLDRHHHPDKTGLLRQLRGNADALAGQAMRLRLYAHLELNKLEHLEEPTDLIGLVDDCLIEFSSEAADKQLNLISYVDPDAPQTLIMDKHSIKTLLFELMENAVKYTRSGGVRVSLISRGQAEGYSRIDLVVANAAAGLPEMTTDTLSTHPVTRRTEHAQSDAPGQPTLGLGLALASRLAQSISADLETTSSLLKGTEVRLSVTARRQSGLTVRAERQLPQLDILLLERNRFVQSGLCDQLIGWGAAVKHIISPKELAEQLANKRFRDRNFDWIIVGDTFTQGRLDDLEQILKALKITYKEAQCLITTARQRHRHDLSHPAYRRHHCLNGPLREGELYRILNRPARFDGNLSSIPGRTPPEQGRPGTGQSAPDAQGLAHRGGQPLRVLLADNEDGYHIVLASLLRQLGYECHQVASGDDVVSAVQSRRYDIILMGVTLAGGNGLEAARRLRRLHPAVTTPILALAPQEMHRDFDLFQSAGMDGHLVKPTQIDTLEDTIRRFAA